jgi:hypothetical protein
MTKLKLNAIEDGKAVKLTLDLPTPVDRDLSAYADAIAQQTGQPAPEKARLAVEMLARFMATDRGFARIRRNAKKSRNAS